MYRFIFSLIFIPCFLNAQNLHISLRAGFDNYQGDLQQKRFTFSQMKPVFSLGARYDITDHFLARTFFSMGNLQATDSKNKSSFLQKRNLSFETKLWEWELGGQYNILSLNDHWWTPYVFAGGALFHVKPFAYDASGTKVFLQPLSTEGQGLIAGKKTYRSLQLAIPFGIGAEYALNEDMRIGLELGYRKTFTDYIDDVSSTYVDEAILTNQRGPLSAAMAYRGDELPGGAAYPPAGEIRGSSRYKDAYYFIQVTFTVRPFVDWYERTSGFASFKKQKRVGCPSTRIY